MIGSKKRDEVYRGIALIAEQIKRVQLEHCLQVDTTLQRDLELMALRVFDSLACLEEVSE
jgi:hypothetical protein